MFQGPILLVLGFHLGSLGSCNHPGNEMASSLLMAPVVVPNCEHIDVPITLRVVYAARSLNSRIKLKTAAMVNRPSCTLFLNEVLVDQGPSPFLSKIEAYDRQLITSIKPAVLYRRGHRIHSLLRLRRWFHGPPNVQAILMTPICPHTFPSAQSSSPIRSS